MTSENADTPSAPPAGSAMVDARAGAIFNQANAAFREGDWETALARANEALSTQPSLLVAAILAARSLANLYRLVEAETAYQAVLAIDPANFTAFLERGNILRRLDDVAAAVTSYEKAVAVAPQDRRGHIALARLLEVRGLPTDRERAAVHYHCALTCSADDPAALADTHHRMSAVRLSNGDLPGALETLRAARDALRQASGPGEGGSMLAVDINIDLAEVFLRLGMNDEAVALMEQASRTESEPHLRRLADLAYRFNYWQEALRILERNAELRPESGQPELAIADIAAKSWQLDLAQAALDRAEQKGCVAAQALAVVRGSILGKLGDPDAAIAHYRTVLAGGDASIASSIAMSTLYSDRMTPEEVAADHRALFANLGEGARAVASFRNDRADNRPLRIGMVSRDLHRQHPVNIFLQPMLSCWDQAEFPLTLYFTGNTRDEQTARAQRMAGTWREIPPERLSELPAMVEEDQIDILIDLAGHTSSAQMALFAQRMAPVQASYLGYPGSTGVPNIDWLFGDPVVTPAAHEHLYSERIARLPETVFCFAPLENYPEPSFPDEVAARPLTFGSFNNIPKLTARTIRLWAAILRALPNARLVLKAASFQDQGAVARYRSLFEAEGVGAARLEFRGPTGLADMMQEYADIDIALDPVPYNGGTTTLQAMWMGAPVLTLEGGHFVSRMGASFMKAAGLSEWVAATDEDYVQRAVRFGAERQALLDLKRGLRSRTKDRPAWNAAHFTRDFGRLLREMWRLSA